MSSSITTVAPSTKTGPAKSPLRKFNSRSTITNANGELKRFYLANGRYAKKKFDSGTQITHTLMNIGVLKIADKDIEQFYEYLIQDFYKEGILYAISEVILPHENTDAVPQSDTEVDTHDTVLLLMLFCELDAVKFPIMLDRAYQLKILQIFCSVLQMFKPTGTFFVYLSNKFHTETSEKYSNLHIQTNVCVTNKSAAKFYAFFLTELELQLPCKSPDDPNWSDVLDIQVMNDGKVNMRLNFCCKFTACPECEPQSNKLFDQSCNSGCNYGYIRGKEYYSVTHVLNQDGHDDRAELARVMDDKVKQLLATSIRPRESITCQDPEFNIPSTCPPPVDSIYKHKHPYEQPFSAFLPKSEKAKWIKGEDLAQNSKAFECIKKLIHSEPQWSKLHICKVGVNYRSKGVNDFCVFVQNIGSNICLNRQPTPDGRICGHKSQNRIWFFITNGFWYQKCFAGAKTENRKNGRPCKDFTSTGFIIPYESNQILFDPKLKETKTQGVTSDHYTSADENRLTKRRVGVMKSIQNSTTINNNSDQMLDNDDDQHGCVITQEEKDIIHQDTIAFQNGTLVLPDLVEFSSLKPPKHKKRKKITSTNPTTTATMVSNIEDLPTTSQLKVVKKKKTSVTTQSQNTVANIPNI